MFRTSGSSTTSDRWLFAIYKDTNKNKQLDKGERLSGEMIHTTPDNEAQAAKGETVTLAPSHGCVHVSPIDRDRLHRAGAFDRGTELTVHPYADVVAAAPR